MKEYIKKYQDFIFERKTFIEHNVKLFLQVISKIPKNEAHLYFVSLRGSSNVTMINPNNEFNTPTGTYTYPLIAFYDALIAAAQLYDNHNVDDWITNIFPFSGNSPAKFFYLYKLKPNIYKNNILTSMSTKADVIKMWEKNFKGDDKYITDEFWADLDGNEYMDVALKYGSSKYGSVVLDNIMNVYKSLSDSAWKIEGGDWVDMALNINSSYSSYSYTPSTPTGLIWWVLLKLYGKDEMRRVCQQKGLYGFIDLQEVKRITVKFVDHNGTNNTTTYSFSTNKNQGRDAFIHSNEPSQAVFFGGRSLYEKIEQYDIERQNISPVSGDELSAKRNRESLDRDGSKIRSIFLDRGPESKIDILGLMHYKGFKPEDVITIAKSIYSDTIRKWGLQDNTQEQNIEVIGKQLNYLFSVKYSKSGTHNNYDKKRKKFPDSLFTLVQLEDLEFIGTNILEIPNGIGKLVNLLYVDFRKNKIKKISPEIGKLKKLISLNLTYNDLLSLPDEISNLKELRKLYVSHNHKNTNGLQFPKTFDKLQNLRVLELNFCELQLLPDEITKLKNLEILTLRGNPLTMLPDNITNLKNLKELHIADCNFSNKELRRIDGLFPHVDIMFV